MPTPETLQRFIARVEAGAHVQAIEEFYTENASMQENDAPPRVGRALLAANEAAVMQRVRTVVSRCIGQPLANGDQVAIRWTFDFEFLTGTRMHMDEITWQRWEGERIAEEKFFYDPAQLKAPSTNA
jgi:SnoaL-like domain